MSERKNVLMILAVVTGVLVLTSVTSAQLPQTARFWSQWRGPDATGASQHANPPLEWSETKNIRWKIEIPGRGSASPVVWDDRLFLLTAVPVGATGSDSHGPRGGIQPRQEHRFVVLAIDRSTGRILWERSEREEVPHEPTHPDNGTWASSSAVTDGEHVFASFESRGLYAYDMNGTLIWQKDLGDKGMRNQFGEGSTPALHGNRLVIVWDHLGGQSFVVALDKRTGEEIWRAERDEIDTWATPLIVESGGRTQVVTVGMNRLRSYDLETGELVWHSPGTTMNPILSPVASDGMVFLTSGFRGNNLKAIRLADARGDISDSSAIVWTLDRETPRTCRRRCSMTASCISSRPTRAFCPRSRLRPARRSISFSAFPELARCSRHPSRPAGVSTSRAETARRS